MSILTRLADVVHEHAKLLTVREMQSFQAS